MLTLLWRDGKLSNAVGKEVNTRQKISLGLWGILGYIRYRVTQSAGPHIRCESITRNHRYSMPLSHNGMYQFTPSSGRMISRPGEYEKPRNPDPIEQVLLKRNISWHQLIRLTRIPIMDSMEWHAIIYNPGCYTETDGRTFAIQKKQVLIERGIYWEWVDEVIVTHAVDITMLERILEKYPRPVTVRNKRWWGK